MRNEEKIGVKTEQELRKIHKVLKMTLRYRIRATPLKKYTYNIYKVKTSTK